MREIGKLLWANLRHKKGSFWGILVLMLVLTLSYAITVNNNDNLRRATNTVLARDQRGDLELTYAIYPTEKMQDTLKGRQEVTGWRVEHEITCVEVAKIDGKECNHTFQMHPEPADYRVLNEKLDGYLTDAPRLKHGETYLPAVMKSQAQFQVGKVIELPVAAGTLTSLTIKGYYETSRAEDDILVSAADFEELDKKSVSVYDYDKQYADMYALCIFTKEGTDPLALKKALMNECDEFEQVLTFSTKQEMQEGIMMYSIVGTKILIAFVAMLLVIILIVMKSSISTTVETEYVNLGILKAMGFGKGKLQLVWILQYSIALALGMVTGLVLSSPMTKVFGGLYVSITGVLTDGRVSIGKCCLYALGIMLVCMVFVILATAKLGKISPVRAISGGKSAVWFDSRFQMPIQKKMLALTIAIRQLTSRWKRYLGAMLIAALLVFFVCTILMMGSGINVKLFNMPIGDVELRFSNDYKDSDIEKFEAIAHEAEADSRILLWTGYYMLVEEENYLVEVYSADEMMTPTLRGRIPKYENEVTMTEVLAELLHKEIGDTITIKNKGKSAEYVITGVFQTLLGSICEITAEGGKRIGVERPDIGYVMLNDKSKKEALAERYNKEMSDLVAATALDAGSYVEELEAQISTILNLILVAIYAISMIFSAVVVTMVCGKTFLMEQTDIGIFKAIGFSVSQLRMQFALRFAGVACAGSVFGCILAACCSEKLLSLLLKMFGVSQFHAEPSVGTFLMPLVVFSVAFFLFAFLSARKIQSVSVRSLITE